MFHNPHWASARRTGLVCDFVSQFPVESEFSLVLHFTALSVTLAVEPVASKDRVIDEFEGLWKETVVAHMT